MSRCLEDVENDYVVICLLLQNTTTISFLLFLIAVSMGCLAPIIPYHSPLFLIWFSSGNKILVIRKFMLRFEQPTVLSFCCFCKPILLEKKTMLCFAPKTPERERELAASPLPCSSLLLTPLPLSYLPLGRCACPHFTTTLIIKAINRFFLVEE